MNRSLAAASLSLATLCAAAACGPEKSGPSAGPCEGLLPGDLVITEVMANPASEDQGNEYFEIYNASGSPQDLSGLTLVASLEDGSSASSHTVDELYIEPGQYLALGGVLPEFRPAWIDYGYADQLGGLRNAGARILLQCGAVEVDSLVYGESDSGRSLGLDGNLPPDSLVNDVLDNFCSATTEFAEGAFGSPGVANEPCSIVSQTTCIDESGTEREVVRPAVGDLVVTEVMPNPDVAADEVGEWFEIEALAAFDLNGVALGEEVGDPKISVFDQACLPVTAGTRIVFARSDDEAENGGLPVVDYTFSFGLSNAGDALFIAAGDEVIDTMTWVNAPTGASLALDPAKTSATANDLSENYCAAVSPYGGGDLGTPGAANTPCALAGVCKDGEDFRPVVAPQPGEVTITEILADPTLVADSAGEWFEVRVSAAVDLNGLQLGDFNPDTTPTPDPAEATDYTISSPDCLSVRPDTYVVFAVNGDAATNGGLPVENLFDAGIGLTNGGEGLFVAYDDALLTTTTYDGSDPGVATSLDPDGEPWCPATDPYNGQDLGTPGAANPQCP